MNRSGAVTMPTCLAIAPGRIRNSSSEPGPASADAISIIALRAPIASISTGPVSPQSRP
jgi:hypothetical protein